MSSLFILVFLLSFSSSVNCDGEPAYISAIISEKGLNFLKDLLIEQAIETLTPLQLPDVTKSKKVPLIGSVSASATKITLSSIDVPESVIKLGDTGIVIVASNATANLSMEWQYSYSTWLVDISDHGTANVQVDGMEVGLTTELGSNGGTLALNVTDCGCYIDDISINLDGGASWFYEGFVIAFEDHIRSAVEKTIMKKISEGALKIDSLLSTLPKEISVDDVAAINVTVVKEPLLGSNSVEFDINGLFVSSKEVAVPSFLHKNVESSFSCGDQQKMLGISLDEDVFNSASRLYFEAGMMHWIVDKVPDQSLLNTGSWKYIIPQLYKKYPNDDMQLNLSFTSPPVIQITSEKISALVYSDMIVNVVDSGELVPVACISVVISASGIVKISGNNLAGNADLNDFSLKLKWSEVGNFHMNLIQGVMRVFLNTVFMPIVNAHLYRGFPLPIIHGFTLQKADILISSSRIVVCSDVVYTGSSNIRSLFL